MGKGNGKKESSKSKDSGSKKVYEKASKVPDFEHTPPPPPKKK